MLAFYYSIIRKSDGEIIDEGIIRSIEDTIYPRQVYDNPTLPYEVEAHHFQSEEFYLEGWNIELNRTHVRRHRSGDKIVLK